MSTKITNIEYIGRGRLTITAEEFVKARAKLGPRYERANVIPELCFLDSTQLLKERSDGAYEIIAIGWRGEDENVLKHFATALSFTSGSADLIVFYDGARSLAHLAGLRVEDGVVTKRAVVMSLGEEVD